MRVLVTGAHGFVGRQVVHGLQRRGQSVYAASHRSPGQVNQPSTEGNDSGTVDFVSMDLMEPDSYQAWFEQIRPEALVHCAWDATPGEYWNTSKNLDWVAASLQLVRQFATCGGQRAVFIGTSAEYEWGPADNLSETSSSLKPNSLYGISKLALHEILHRWAVVNSSSYAWARLFCPFGELEKSARLVPKLIHQLQHEPVINFDSGRNVRDFLHVDDVGDALAALTLSNLNGPINIASGIDTTIRELVMALADALQSKCEIRFEAVPDRDDEPPRIVADVTRLRQELNWHPLASFTDRIAQTCRYATKHNLSTSSKSDASRLARGESRLG